ncbi:MAG: thiamine pyrophosphate-binding protein [Chloroflexia bacterium]
MQRTGGQVVVEMLRALQVHHIFGVPGETSLAFYDALCTSQDGPRHILVRDERSAAYMADVYARVSFRPGVCEAPSGAGVTYLASGLAEPHASSIPVVALTSDTPVVQEERNVLTALDQPALFAPISKYRTLVKEPERIPDALRAAFRSATTGRPGASVVVLPTDVLAASCEDLDLSVDPRFSTYPAYPVRPDPGAVEEAAQRLARAERPAIVAGGGVVSAQAWSELTALAEALQAPVGTSICGKGAIAEDHPLALGVVGGNGARPYANEFLRQADLILFVGCKTDSVTTLGWTLPPRHNPPALIHLDIDPAEIGRNYPASLGLVGDARLGLADLLEALPRRFRGKRDWLARLERERERFWAEFAGRAASIERPIRPQRVIECLSRLLPRDSILVADAGTPTPFAAAYYPSPAGRHVVIPRGYGGLGYAIPGVLAAKLARPEATVVGLMGDGSFGMSAGELETVARLGLPVLIVQFNNGCFGWIKVFQHLEYGGRCFGVDFSRDTDHAAIARGFGLAGYRVEEPEELEQVLQEALACGRPAFVDVLTACETVELPPVEKWQRAWAERLRKEGPAGHLREG